MGFISELKMKEDAHNFHELAKQFRKLADIADKVGEAYDLKDESKIEEVMKDFTWEFLKMQKM